MHHTDPAEPPEPDASVIAAQNDAFRRLACLGVAPDQLIQGRLHVPIGKADAGVTDLMDHDAGSPFHLAAGAEADHKDPRGDGRSETLIMSATSANHTAILISRRCPSGS